MVALQQFSGCFAFLFNAASVFEGSGANYISPDAAVIIVGAAQLAGSHGATLVIDRIGRKPLLCIGCSGVAAGMASFGVAARYADDSMLLKIIPIAALAFSILMANATFFPLTSVILSEVAPSKVIYVTTAALGATLTISFHPRSFITSSLCVRSSRGCSASSFSTCCVL